MISQKLINAAKALLVLTIMLVSATTIPSSVIGDEAVGVGKSAPNFTLTDTYGKSHSLSDFKGKFVVLEWVNFGCPFVVKHYGSNNMQSLQKKYTAKNVVWLSINSSAQGKEGYFTADEVNTKIKEQKGAATHYLLDTDGKVGKMFDAKTTPHMFVIDPSGKLIYAGAIDDKASTDQADVKTAKNYVSQALDEAMAGKEVSTKSVKAYGCKVKY